MPLIVLIYSILVLVGGWIGHLKTGSMASLISGLTAGSLLLVAAGGMFWKRRWGTYSALLLTLILDGFFTYRFLITHKFMPAGLLSLISLVVLLLLARSIPRKKV
jgi:uncharacterized membrane protein (UPF0136 family)